MSYSATVATTLIAIVSIAAIPSPSRSAPLPGFRAAPWFGNQVMDERTPEGVRIHTNCPGDLDPSKPTLVVFFATPNGNTIEQTLGSEMQPGLDWHYDIQHIAAQTRKLREVDTRENIVLVVVQPDERSWPAWRAKHTDNGVLIRSLVAKVAARIPGSPVSIALTGHSGGGSFIIGYLNGGEAIPDNVVRIGFLDANYSYSDDDKHGDKLLAWLKGDAQRHLVVLAYDDRNITLDGKPVVGPTGGTWRASHRMIDRFQKEAPLTETSKGDLVSFYGMNGQVQLILDKNPKNKILHTVLVETNGFTHVITLGTPEEGKAGAYRGKRAYTQFIQPAVSYAPIGTQTFTGIPARPTGALGGHAFMNSIATFSPTAREAAILAELGRGNIPNFLRSFKTLEIRWGDAKRHRLSGRISIMPDYLAVGSDSDFVRVPMTPMTAQKLADQFGCSLITRRISDVVFQESELKLDPHPMTVDRETVATFIQHNDIIEGQRAGKPLGLLVCGIKKDVVLTNLLAAAPTHVAIYGWHYTNGTPIQPLTTVHINTYVDYSHGIRFMARQCVADGKQRDVREVMKDARLSPMLSDEGPMTVVSY